MKIEPATWDSDFFGLKVGKCRLTYKDDWDQAGLNNWDLVYFFVDPSDARANKLLASMDHPLVDRKTTFLLHLSDKSPSLQSSPRIHIYLPSSKDSQVIELGIQSGIYSRFNVDPRFEPGTFRSLYSIWMQRSISREIADEVFVCRSRIGEILGVITVGGREKRAEIGILAVDENYRGQNIGKELVEAVIAYSKNKGYTELQVVTQEANEKACKFYHRCAFKKVRVDNIYHYWKNLK